MSSKEEERQCRICLQGADASLGRLFKPCRCDGSIKYVHVECLSLWRKANTSRSAFYQCPQCHYKYRFSRTRIVGLATSPLILSALSLATFTIIVYSASFIGSFILSHFDDRDDGYSSTFSYFFWDPITATRDLVTSAVHLADDITGSTSNNAKVNWSSSTPRKMPSKPGILARLIQRFLLGLSVVGITSVAQLLWSMSLVGPFRYLRTRGLRDRRERGGGSVLTIIVAGLIIAGAIRALLQVYRFVERKTQNFLVRAEYSILEVND